MCRQRGSRSSAVGSATAPAAISRRSPKTLHEAMRLTTFIASRNQLEASLVAAEAGTILRTMRDLIEAHTPGVLPPIDLDAPPQET